MNGSTTHQPPDSQAARQSDLDRQPTWANFDFGGEFDLKPSPAPAYLDGRPPNGSDQASPRAEKQSRLDPNSSPGSPSGPSKVQPRRQTSGYAAAVPPVPSHYSTLAQSYVQRQSPTLVDQRKGSPVVQQGSPTMFGIPVTALSERDWNGSPALEPEYADGLAKSSPRNNKTGTDRSRFSPSNGLGGSFPASTSSPMVAATFASQTSTPRDSQRARMSNAVTSSPSDNSAAYDSSVAATPKASASTGFRSQLQQQQQQQQQQQPHSQRPSTTGWERQAAPTPPVHRPFSSADAYNQPLAPDMLQGNSRPETAASHLSGDNWMHEGTGNRSSYSTIYSGTANQAKRSSVLSFQTALSGGGLDGFMSGDEGRASSRDDDFEEAFEAPSRSIAINARSGTRDNIQPWLQSRSSSGYGTSPDERTIPGALPAGAWGESFFRSSTSGQATGTMQQQQRSSYRQSPNSSSARLSTPGKVGLGGAPVPPLKDPPVSAIPPPLPTKAAPQAAAMGLPPIQTQHLSRSQSGSMLSIPSPPTMTNPSSSTIGPPSDDAAPGSSNLTTDTALPTSRQNGAWPQASTSRTLTFAEPIGPAAVDVESGAALSDNVIPPPLPIEVAAAVHRPGEPPAAPVAPAAHKPVSDFRRKPLANITPEQQAAGLAHLHALGDTAGRRGAIGTAVANDDGGVMAAVHPPSKEATVDATASKPVQARRGSNASLLPMAALAQPPAATSVAAAAALLDRPTSPSIEAPSREPSPPPDGEVEARAEWERTQMKRKQRTDALERNSRSTGTIRSQLRPLQLVPADSLSANGDGTGVQGSGLTGRSPSLRTLGAANGGRLASSAIGEASSAPTSAGAAGAAAATASGGGASGTADQPTSDMVVSTQQLQRNQAREQRRSVGAFSASMAAANAVSGGSNGPYPIFASPTGVIKKGGARQYPGSMPQRSLVPPFELQNRPDGLPSGLIGPDGVRRSINDPEVCLECMMRDEDMIDVQVVGDGIWERESDKEFNEALRLEAEEAARGKAATEEGDGSVIDHGSAHGSSSNRHPPSSSERAQSRNSGPILRHVKKIGRGEPLTSERLKLHTQMNPPASSHRWRTLQTFLAVQAKYIAMEHQRLKMEAERRRSAGQPDGTATNPEAERRSPVAASSSGRDYSAGLKSRSSSGSLLKNTIVMDDEGLSAAEREEKLRDIASARAARNKMAGGMASDPLPLALPPSAAPPPVPTASASVTTLPRMATPSHPQPILADEAGRRSTPNILAESGSLTSPSAIGRGVSAGRRAASTQELRQASGSASSPAIYPSSPAESLAPPSRPFAPSSPGAGSRIASRSGASQLSLVHSGSMIDMHVGLEDRTEHRLNQTGFIPGTPVGIESPGALSRSFYGFPGDGDVPAPDMASEQSKVVPGEGYVDPEKAEPVGMRSFATPAREESFKRKKKGFRGLISKFTGSGSSTPNQSASNGNNTGAGSVHGSVASRNASRRSMSSSGARDTSASVSYDPTGNPMPPPFSSGGLISKARKSMSLFTDPSQPMTADDEAIQRSRSQVQLSSPTAPFQNPPGMASQTSLDLGPFQQTLPSSSGIGKRGSHLHANGPDGQTQTQTQTPLPPQPTRKASNPLMQRYLNLSQPGSSSSLRNEAGYGPSAVAAAAGTNGHTDLRNSRVGREARAYGSSRSISAAGSPMEGTPTTIYETGAEEKADQRSLSSVSRSSLRKELPPMPHDLAEQQAGQPQVPAKHSRSGSSGVPGPVPAGRQSMNGNYGAQAPASSGRTSGAWQLSEASGRPSMQAARPVIPFGSPLTSAPPQLRHVGPASPNGSYASPSDQGSLNDGPRRPPRNPRRPDNLPASPSFTSSTDTESNAGAVNQSSFGQAMETEFPASGVYDSLPRGMSSTSLSVDQSTPGKNRASKLLRLPFGRKKRESSVETRTGSASAFVGGRIETVAEAPPRKSNVGLGPPPMLRNRQSYSGLAPPKASMQMERPRVLSSPVDDRADVPPRSRSAFGMLSTQRLASSPGTRLSTDVRRGPFGEERWDEDDEDDDEMGYDRDYQPGPFGSSGLTVPQVDGGGGGGSRRNSTSVGGTSFGRKSLNLLREGLKLPVATKQTSPEQQRKKRFGF